MSKNLFSTLNYVRRTVEFGLCLNICHFKEKDTLKHVQLSFDKEDFVKLFPLIFRRSCQEGERMDKIGEANKPFEARVSDLLEVERRKKEGDEKTVVVYQPKDVEVIDTSAFIKTDMKYGLDFVFRLVDSVNLIQKSKFRRHTWKPNLFLKVLPGEQMPAFLCPSLVGDQEMLFTSDQLAGKTTLLFFYSKDFGGDLLFIRQVFQPQMNFQPRARPAWT